MANSQGVMVQSIVRAADIMECFSEQTAELGISDIAKQMQLSKSTIYGLVNTLVTVGYLEQNPQTKRYRLGIKLFELGNLVHRRMDLRNEARPFCEALVQKHNVTVHLAARYGDEIIYIDKVDAPGTIIIYSQTGKRAPVYCTGVGKAILAFTSEDGQKRLLKKEKFQKFTEQTIIDTEKLCEEIMHIRSCGYAIDNEEIEGGLRCIAAPIFNHIRQAVGAISVSGSTFRLPEDQIETIARDVQDCAYQISQRLGYSNSEQKQA